MDRYTYFLLCLSPFLVFAQKIDHMGAVHDMKSENYFRVHYDNDYFTATDHYYTQGYNFELTSRSLRKNPINVIFPKLKNSDHRYGVSLEHLAFVPTSIKADTIQSGDRPYAAALMIGSFLIATDTVRRQRIASQLNIGVIGPWALAYEMQSGIHRLIGDEKPLGWSYQIRNDLLLNYELTHEMQLCRYRELFALHSNARLRLGTVNTNISGGVTVNLGKVNIPFAQSGKKQLFLIYAYYQPMVTLVGYDAYLQGGILFGKDSPHTLPNSEISRVTLQQNYGIVLQLKRLFFEYSRSEITREYVDGIYHKWGGFRIGFEL